MEPELITGLGAGAAFLIIALREVLNHRKDRQRGKRDNPGLGPVTERLDTLVTIAKDSHGCIKELSRSVADLDASWNRSVADLKAITERSSEDVLRAVRNVEERVARLERGE